MAKRLFLAILLVLVCASPLWGKDYYVANNGTNQSSCISSPGIGSPCQTISYVIANAKLVGGDTVYIRGGTYTEAVVVNHNDDGDAINGYVTFKTYGNEDVTLRTTSSSFPLYIWDSTGNNLTQYVKFDGRGNDFGYHLNITTTAASRNIVIRYADHIWLTGINSYGAQNDGHGIYFLSINMGTDSGGSVDDKGPKNCIIEYCKFYNNLGHGIKVTGWGTNNNTFRYLEVYNNGDGSGDDCGMNLSGSGYAANMPTGNIIHDCNFHHSGNSPNLTVLYAPQTQVYNNEISWAGDIDNDGVCEYSSARGLSISTDSDNCMVYNNTIFNNCYYNLIVSGANSNLIYNNVIYRTTGTNPLVVFDQAASGNRFYNNSVYGSGTSGYTAAVYIKGSEGVTGTDLRNNIIWAVGPCYPLRSENDTSGRVFNNNLYAPSYDYKVRWGVTNYSNISAFNISESPEASGNTSEDPQWDSDYGLTASSPQGAGHVRDGALDLSSIFITDKNGYTRAVYWDMGAFEYGANAMAPKPPSGLMLKK